MMKKRFGLGLVLMFVAAMVVFRRLGRNTKYITTAK